MWLHLLISLCVFCVLLLDSKPKCSDRDLIVKGMWNLEEYCRIYSGHVRESQAKIHYDTWYIYFVLYSKFGVFGIWQSVFRCDKVSHTTMLLTITVTVAKFVAGVAKIFKVGDVVPHSQWRLLWRYTGQCIRWKCMGTCNIQWIGPNI